MSGTFTHFFSLVPTWSKRTAQAQQISHRLGTRHEAKEQHRPTKFLVYTFRASAEQIASEQIFYGSPSSSVPKPSEQLNCRLKSPCWGTSLERRENFFSATKIYSTLLIAIKISKIFSLPSNKFCVFLVATPVKTYLRYTC
jgi:hypothetical protein